jgi:hypothetical protein
VDMDRPDKAVHGFLIPYWATRETLPISVG